MTLRIAPPGTPMADAVLEFAQYAADRLDRTQFIVMERRTWERLMPNDKPATASQMTTPPRQSQPGAGNEPPSSVPAARQEAQPVMWQLRYRSECGSWSPWSDAHSERELLDGVMNCRKEGITDYETRTLYASPAPEQEARGWRTMESAPKDGSHILIGIFEKGSVGFGYTDGVYQPWQCVVHWWGYGPENEHGFYKSSGGSAEIDDNPVYGTHWMPLPAPPAMAAPPKEPT